METNNKLVSIHILEILNEYSNKDHKITQEEIMRHLENIYGESISRHTCSDYLKELRFKGYILGSRGVYRSDLFSERELRTLIDGIMYGKHITEKEAEVLIDKLKKLSLYSMKDKAKNLSYFSGVNRTENENLYPVLDQIDDAILNQNRIEIVQYSVDANKVPVEWDPKVVDPYFVVSDQSRYYLLCHGDRDGIEPKRIDHISSVRILDEKRKSLLEVCGYDFDLGQYMREHVNMFSGETGRVEVKVDNHHISSFIDWFGGRYTVLEENEEYSVLSVKTNLNAAFYWALQYGMAAEVIYPLSLRYKLKETIKEMNNKYSSQE